MTDDIQKNVFSSNLNHLLLKHKKTQREVADAIGVSPQTFNTWCMGIALPRMGKLQSLADYFNVSKSALIEPPSEDDLEYEEAIELYKKYKNAIPEIQAAVEGLLKAVSKDS